MSGLFSFRSGKSESVPATSAIVPPIEGNIAANQAATEAIEASRTSRKRSARQQGKAGQDTSGTGPPVAQSAELRSEIARQLEAAYDPKAWGALLAAPADAALAITGHKHWDVSKDERETLGACGSVAARYLMIEHPKTLALMMVSSALFSVYVPRLTEEFKVRRKVKTTAVVTTEEKKRAKYFIFARLTGISLRHGRNNVFVQVEAFDKDHAVNRLVEKFPHVERKEWDFLEEMDLADTSGKLHDIGSFGTKLPLAKPV